LVRGDGFEEEFSEQEGRRIAPGDRRPLGRLVNTLALWMAAAAAVGSLLTALAFNITGAEQLSAIEVVLISGAVSLGVYLMVLLGGRHRDSGAG
jgi:hypothetical protein